MLIAKKSYHPCNIVLKYKLELYLNSNSNNNGKGFNFMHENNLPKQFEYDLTQVATIDDYLTELNRQETEYQDITDLVINNQLTVSIASQDFNAIISVIKGLPMPLRRIGGKYLDINLKDHQLDVTFAAFDFLHDIDSSISNDKFTEFSNAITDFRNAVHALADAQKTIAQDANNESSMTRPDESKKASEVQNKPSTANESQSGLSDTNTLDQILTDADKKQAAKKDDDIMPPLYDFDGDASETTNSDTNDITNDKLAAYLNNTDGDDLDLDDTDEQDSTSSSTNPDTSQDSTPKSNTNDDIMPALDNDDTQNETVNDDLPDIDGADSDESEQYNTQYASEENVDNQESVNDDLPSINETTNSADNSNNSNDNADQESTEMPETLTEPKVEHEDTTESANESTNASETNPVHSSTENVDQSTNITQESNTTNPVNVTPGTTATSDTQSTPVQNSNINTALQPNQVSNQVQAQPPAQTAGLPQINNQSANQILKLLYAGFNQLIAGVVQEVQKQNNAAQTNNQPPQQSTPKQPDEDPLDEQYNQLKSENDKQIALLLRNMSDNDNIARDDENPDNK